jgi:hypothetical protein
MGKKSTQYVVRFSDDFKERSAELESFDLPASIFEYADAIPGPQLITIGMVGLYTHLISLERRGKKFSLEQFRKLYGRCSLKRMVATFEHMEALELIECANLRGAKPDTLLEIKVLVPYDSEELEENRLKLWERVKTSSAFRKKRASRPTTRARGVH